MRHLFYPFILCALLLAACTPVVPPPAPTATVEGPSATPAPSATPTATPTPTATADTDQNACTPTATTLADTGAAVMEIFLGVTQFFLMVYT